MVWSSVESLYDCSIIILWILINLVQHQQIHSYVLNTHCANFIRDVIDILLTLKCAFAFATL